MNQNGDLRVAITSVDSKLATYIIVPGNVSSPESFYERLIGRIRTIRYQMPSIKLAIVVGFQDYDTFMSIFTCCFVAQFAMPIRVPVGWLSKIIARIPFLCKLAKYTTRSLRVNQRLECVPDHLAREWWDKFRLGQYVVIDGVERDVHTVHPDGSVTTRGGVVKS